MKMKSLIIYGTGAIAEVAEFYFRRDSERQIAAFTNAGEYISQDRFLDHAVYPFETIEKLFPPEEFDIFIAIGYKKTNQLRRSRFLEAKAKGYSCASYISTKASYFGNSYGENCLVLENNVIQPYVTLGNNVFLWSGNHVGHHSKICDHSFVSSHVVISGNCIIGQCAFLGVNATLRDNIVLGDYCVISPGAVVMENCQDRSVVTAPKSEVRLIKRDVI
ncbi:acetyltransferase [Methylobacterium sp. NEAU 140]|uniref:acetyltransferase n=1 Tax=Methylobacterium sp. NEAU 140 TaxID=3064945 RepID=UPI002736F7DA|nr:acetyltransferase [Methylobacterium sp. NEAU 140]MDP4026008.1 acetyltransferase [Methylobacterium sp. NEAU 140]